MAKTILVCLLAFCSFAILDHTTVGRDAAAATPQLDAETIRAGLRTTTQEENGFIDHVLALVHQGRLSAGLVYRVFLWARQKPEHQFQYFRRAMIILAAKRGIRL